tara:strand:- start:154 stop:273 length:120 start_codon:yes stop_codon:yes gene_type:complete
MEKKEKGKEVHVTKDPIDTSAKKQEDMAKKAIKKFNSQN